MQAEKSGLRNLAISNDPYNMDHIPEKFTISESSVSKSSGFLVVYKLNMTF